MTSPLSVPALTTRLTVDGCRLRQRRLAQLLERRNLAAAFLTSRKHVYYFTGCWLASYLPVGLFMEASGHAALILPDETLEDAVAVDEMLTFRWQKLGTIVDDPLLPMHDAVAARVSACGTCGCDNALSSAFYTGQSLDISRDIALLRRAKDADEVGLILTAIGACDASFARATEFVRPGVREIDVYAEVFSAAVQALGEPIGELGNDFQSGTGGGPPRMRRVQAGELMPLDVSINFRGYRCDLCRTLIVGGEPSADQTAAAERVIAAIEFVEQAAGVGVSARSLYEQACNQLKNDRGWSFPHHLGHGIGLGIHEAPRLNPHWDDHLELGDVYTIEPGLYGDELRGGVRIEDNYFVGTQGISKLSSFPRDLILAGD